MKFKVKNKVWIWSAKNGVGWHFVTIPPKTGLKIAKLFSGLSKGFGSLPVTAYFDNPENKKEKIILETSIFPSNKNYKEKVYLLPIKKTIRLQAGIQEGDTISFILEVK